MKRRGILASYLVHDNGKTSSPSDERISTRKGQRRTYFIRRPKKHIKLRIWVRVQVIDYCVRICSGYRAQEVAGIEEARVEEADIGVRALSASGGGCDATY